MAGGPPSVERRLLSYSRPARLFLYLAIASGFVAAMIVVGQAWLLSSVVSDIFIDDKSMEHVQPFLFAMLALAFARAAVVAASDVLGQRSASHLKGKLRADLTDKLSRLGPAYIRNERSGELVHTAVEGVEDMDEYIASYQPQRFLAVLVPAFVALVVFAIDSFTVLILLVTGPVLVLFLTVIGSRAKDITERRFYELGWMSASFLDLLQGLVTLKLFGRSREQVGTIRDISRQYGKTTMEVLRTAFETSLVLELSATIATALVAVEISFRLVEGGLPFDRALAVLIITPEFFLPLRQLATRYHAGAAGKAAGERILPILDARQAPISAQYGVPPEAPQRMDISFENVGFAYDGGERPALHGLSLHIPHGTRVALCGPTGAGKTTAASLLLRFIEPDTGRITVSGRPLSSFTLTTWRSQVGWVPQHPYLFYGTVSDNIRLGRQAATDRQVVSAAVAAHAHEFITRLPRGYNTPIGERGARLSGGEQQRLAIARAFLKDSPFLILDEPTSHLDSEDEALIQVALTRLVAQRTVLIIAHRSELIHHADRVVMMREGRAVDIETQRLWPDRGDSVHQFNLDYEPGPS